MTGIVGLDAFIVGIISAISLPIGAALSFFWIPKPRLTAIFMAFGAGALLAALSVELVAEAIRHGHYYPLAAGAVAGGVFFVILNSIVNSHGGFLRKTATSITHLRRKKVKHLREISRKISRVHLFNHLTPEEIQALVPYIAINDYSKGKTIVHQNDPADMFFLIEKGEVDIIDEAKNEKVLTLSQNHVFGEIDMITCGKYSHTAIAASDVQALVIYKQHFDRILKISPKLADDVKNMINHELKNLEDQKIIPHEEAEAWLKRSVEKIEEGVFTPTSTEIKEAAQEHKGAPLAIWLGILLDGIPESIVIGISVLEASKGTATGSIVSLSLIAGLFLSNFPEALSSSVGMRQNKLSKSKILWMWLSIMIITGIGAWFGCSFFIHLNETTFAFVDGLAAGAMLTMIAETMLPEAFHIGGTVTGLSTLAGFLATLLFKVL